MISLSPRGNKWEVDEEYRTEVLGETIVIPQGFVSDLASVPRILWLFISPFGRYTEASVVHDYLYLESDLPRKKCDEIFYVLMLRNRTNPLTARVFYKTVRFLGWIYY